MVVDGVERKVVMQAPKNGFFYVIDRTDGELLRAHPYGAMNWATHVDMETGRPVENPDAAWEETPQWMLPGNIGSHNWEPMAFDAESGLVYIPTHDVAFFFALPEDYVKTGVYRPRERTMNLGVATGRYRAKLIEEGAAPAGVQGLSQGVQSAHRRDSVEGAQRDRADRRRAGHGRRPGVPG